MTTHATPARKEGKGDENLRDRSCLLRCSLLLKALLQNWHLYFFSGTSDDDFRIVEVDDAAVGKTLIAATGIVAGIDRGFRGRFLVHRSMVEYRLARERGRRV